MNDVDMKELEIMIPSKDVRNYVLEKGITFTDRAKVALIYNFSCQLSIDEIYFYFQRIIDSTNDEKLKMQLIEYIDEENNKLKIFKENPDRIAVYVLYKLDEDEEEDFYDCFFKYDIAYREGLKLMDKSNNPSGFMIRKYLVTDDKEYDHNDPHYCENSAMKFNLNGIAMYVSMELPNDGNYNNLRNYFFELPNPFERGDIVVATYNKHHHVGVVATSNHEWHESLGYFISPDLYSNAFNVDFITKNGDITYDHVLPIEFERYQPCTDENATPEDNFLIFLSKLYRGEDCSLVEFYDYQEEYRKYLKEHPEH